jgi:hypothetical protein
MAKRSWFSVGADRTLNVPLSRFMPLCDEPPTTASSLEAATDVARLAEEERDRS